MHRALRVKAPETDQSLSELVNAAVRATFAEDPDDTFCPEREATRWTRSSQAIVRLRRGS